jgi:Protein of unknown function (DUF2829)
MKFGQALELLRNGESKLFRRNWNHKGMYIQAQLPDENSKMTEPYIFIAPCSQMKLPWVASQADIFAEDWELSVL